MKGKNEIPSSTNSVKNRCKVKNLEIENFPSWVDPRGSRTLTMRGLAVWRALILIGALRRCAPFRVSSHSAPVRCAALRHAACPSAPLRGCGMLGRGEKGGPARAPRVGTVGRPPVPSWRPSVPLGLQMMAGNDAMDQFADDLLCQVQFWYPGRAPVFKSDATTLCVCVCGVCVCVCLCMFRQECPHAPCARASVCDGTCAGPSLTDREYAAGGADAALLLPKPYPYKPLTLNPQPICSGRCRRSFTTSKSSATGSRSSGWRTSSTTVPKPCTLNPRAVASATASPKP